MKMILFVNADNEESETC